MKPKDYNHGFVPNNSGRAWAAAMREHLKVLPKVLPKVERGGAFDVREETMTPHLCKSFIYPGLWMCVAKRASSDPRRAYEPVPNALTMYGATPRIAYERWLEYGKL